MAMITTNLFAHRKAHDSAGQETGVRARDFPDEHAPISIRSFLASINGAS